MSKTENFDISIKTGLYKDIGRTNTETEECFREFIDNSTSSFFDHKDELEQVANTEMCKIVIQRDDQKLVILDNAYGMNRQEFNNAMQLGAKAAEYSKTSRGQYGLGLKYAAASLGNCFSIESTALNSNEKFSVTVDLDFLEANNPKTLPVTIDNCLSSEHYTKITITKLTRVLGNSLQNKRKKKENRLETILSKLAEIYSYDIKNGNLEIVINSRKVTPHQPELYEDPVTGSPKFAPFERSFTHNGQIYKYSGWVGCLKTATTSGAGFALNHKNRAIQLNYRPSDLFGRSNDYRYQRIIGEISLDSENWIVSFTKNGIKWGDDGLENDFILSLIKDADVKAVFDFAKSFRSRASGLTKEKLNKIEAPSFQTSEEITSIGEQANTQKAENSFSTPSTIENEDSVFVENSQAIRTYNFNYNGVNYIFNIHLSNDFVGKTTDNYLKILNGEKENEYTLVVCDTCPLFRQYTSMKEKQLVLNLAICLALAALESEKQGVSLDNSYAFIGKLNEIIDNFKI